MKAVISSTFLLLSSTFSFGQCNKDVAITASKTEYLTASGAVQRTDDEQSIIEINKAKVIITPGNTNRQTIGMIESTTCNWSTAYQDGKMVMRAVFDDLSDGQRHSTLTVEGKAGTITLLMEIAETPDKKILVNVTSFKETKKD